MNVVVTNCTVMFDQESPTGNREAFLCTPEMLHPRKVAFRTSAKFIYIKSLGGKWKATCLGDDYRERRVELSLDEGETIYVWPGFNWEN